MKINRQKVKRVTLQVLILLLWCAVVITLGFALAFSSKQESEQTCKKVQVTIYPIDIHFFNRQRVLEQVRNSLPDKQKLIGTPLVQLPVAAMEAGLKKASLLEDAQVHFDLNGNLHLEVRQRRPILRVIRIDGTEFYLDKYGVKMPLSEHFTAAVPIATGNIFERYEKEDSVYSFVGKQLFKLASYVDKDEFFKALIEQIFVRADNEMVLVPRIGSKTIVFGEATDMEKKFDKLLIFYQEGLNRIGWNRYNSIDLRFEGQVVCK